MSLFLTGALGVMLLLALIFGFTGAVPRFRSRIMQGTALVFLGVIAVWVPLQFTVSALLIGFGTRMIWLAAPKETFVTDAEINMARSRDLLAMQNRWEVVSVRGESSD